MLDKNHNNPPDPIDEALAPFGDVISEAENWLDGSPVENEAQMKAEQGDAQPNDDGSIDADYNKKDDNAA